MRVDVTVMRTVRDPFTGTPGRDIGSRTIGWVDADGKSIEIDTTGAPVPQGIYTVAKELHGMPLPKVVLTRGRSTEKETGGVPLPDVLVA